MARRERGILLNDSRILALTGKEVRTFVDCDKSYLELQNVTPGDFISFARGYGTDDAVDFKVATPTEKEEKTLAEPKFAAAIAKAKADHKGRPARRAAPKTKAVAKAAAPVKSDAKATVGPIIDKLVRLGVVQSSVDVDAVTKVFAKKGGLDESTTARVLVHLKCPRVVVLPDEMDAWFARTLDAALEGAPVRVANLAASFKTGFQVVFRKKKAALETSWFTSAHDVVSKLDEHLAQQKSSLRAYWLRHTKTKRVLFIATAAQANELGATS